MFIASTRGPRDRAMRVRHHRLDAGAQSAHQRGIGREYRTDRAAARRLRRAVRDQSGRPSDQRRLEADLADRREARGRRSSFWLSPPTPRSSTPSMPMVGSSSTTSSAIVTRASARTSASTASSRSLPARRPHGQRLPFALVAEIREWWQGLADPVGLHRDRTGGPGGRVARRGPRLRRFAVPGVRRGQHATRVQADDHRQQRQGHRGHQWLHRRRRLLPAPVDFGERPRSETLVRPHGIGVNVSGGGSNKKAWRDIWSAGQGIGAVKSSGPAGDYIDWPAADYARARSAMGMART